MARELTETFSKEFQLQRKGRELNQQETVPIASNRAAQADKQPSFVETTWKFRELWWNPQKKIKTEYILQSFVG